MEQCRGSHEVWSVDMEPRKLVAVVVAFEDGTLSVLVVVPHSSPALAWIISGTCMELVCLLTIHKLWF